jgi:hypothetical protein
LLSVVPVASKKTARGAGPEYLEATISAEGAAHADAVAPTKAAAESKAKRRLLAVFRINRQFTLIFPFLV